MTLRTNSMQHQVRNVWPDDLDEVRQGVDKDGRLVVELAPSNEVRHLSRSLQFVVTNG